MMSIELTHEQGLALQSLPEGPVEVVDPATTHRYVLLRLEHFDRVKAMLGLPEPETNLAGTTRPCPPVPQRLADLPTPPEVLERARRHQRNLGLMGTRALTDIVEELKLQFYFGGQYIRCLPTPQGRLVVAIHAGDDEAYRRQIQALSPQQKERAVVLVPTPWQDETSEVLGFTHHEG